MRTRLVVGGALLLAFWFTRLTAVESFPPFLDEAIHIYYSEVVAAQNPLAYSEDGRQLTIWLYALFESHRGAPLFVARTATLLITAAGYAALAAASRLLAGQWGALFAGALLLTSPYHYFFERLALADPVSAGLALVSLYFAVRLTRRVSLLDAALCGVTLFLAVSAKVTALPLFVIVPAAALLLPRGAQSWRQRACWAATALTVGLGLTAVYLAALYAFGYNALTYVLDGAGGAAGSPLAALAALISPLPYRAQRILEDVSAYLSAPGLALLLISALLLVHRWRFLPAVLAVSAAAYLASSRVETRHVVVSVSLLLLSGGVALAELLRKRLCWLKAAALVGISAAGLLLWLPLASAVQRDPLSLPLPSADYAQYVVSDASGLGLPELRAELEARQPREVIALIANCQGLRYLALGVVPVTCPTLNPSGANIPALLDLLEARRAPGVYAVLEANPYVPASAPGQIVTTLTFPVPRPPFTVYDLAP